MLELKNVNLAVEFADWIGNNYFEQNQDQIWTTELLKYSGCLYSTQELFNQFWKEYNDKQL